MRPECHWEDVADEDRRRRTASKSCLTTATERAAIPWLETLSRVDLRSLTTMAGLPFWSGSSSCPRLLRSLACRETLTMISSGSSSSSSSMDGALPGKRADEVTSFPS